MGGIRLPGPQPANPSNPAAIRAINKPCMAPRGSPGRGGRASAGSAAGSSSGAAPGTPEIYCVSCRAAPGAPAAPFSRRTRRKGCPTEPTRSTRGPGGALESGVLAVARRPWARGSGPVVTAADGWWSRGGAGRATEWAKRPSCSGFGVLMAKPRGGVKVWGGCEVWGSAGARSCSATLLVPPRFLSVPVATGGSRRAPGARDDPCLLPSPAGNRHGGTGQRCGVATSHPALAFGGAASPCCGAGGF